MLIFCRGIQLELSGHRAYVAPEKITSINNPASYRHLEQLSENVRVELEQIRHNQRELFNRAIELLRKNQGG